MFAGRYLQTVAVPVRRNHQNGFGLGKFLCNAAEALVERVFRVQRVHRAAMSDKQYGHFVHGVSQFVLKRMILRETFARTIPFGEEYVFLVGNHGAFFGFCVLFLLVKGCLKVWMMVWLVYEKQPALML